MYDFRQYNLRDMFRIRDCLETLDEYGLGNPEMLIEVKHEIGRRADNDRDNH